MGVDWNQDDESEYTYEDAEQAYQPEEKYQPQETRPSETTSPPPEVKYAKSSGPTTGAFSLDKATGDRLIKLLDSKLDSVDSLLGDIGRTARPPSLGTNEVATAMSAKFERRAVGDADSFGAAVSAFREVLQTTRDTVEGAMRATKNSDQKSSKKLKNIY